jgi:hypothetical protein
VLLPVGVDACAQNLLQRGALLYCVVIPVRDTYLVGVGLLNPNLDLKFAQFALLLASRLVLSDSIAFVDREKILPGR